MRSKDLFLLSLFCLFTHVILLKVGLALTNSDYAFMALESDRFSWNSWSAFYEGQGYGGTLLSTVRALWNVSLARLSLPISSLQGHLIFSYLVCPLLMTWASFFMASGYLSRSGAWVVGLLAAMGFQFWIGQYGNDFYVGYLLLGWVLLGIRGRVTDPLRDLNEWQLLGIGILSGLACWTHRASVLFVVAFFLSPQWLIQEFKELVRARGPWNRSLRILITGFLGLYFYLDLFGSNIGTIFGRKVILHAHPNLHFALFFTGILFLGNRWHQVTGNLLRRWSMVVAGFFLGLGPEILHWVYMKGQPPPPGSLISIPEMMTILSKVPESMSLLFSSDTSILRNFSLALLIVGLFTWVMLFFKSKKEKFIPLMILGILSLYAYGRLQTYTLGAPRYLLPFFPVMLISLGALWEHVSLQRWKRVSVMILIFGHLISQGVARVQQVKTLTQSHYLGSVHHIIERFQNSGIEFVISNHYWESNQFTLASERRPAFYFSGGLAPRDIKLKFLKLMSEGSQLGYLEFMRNHQPQMQQVAFMGQSHRLKFLEEIGSFRLYQVQNRF